VARISLKKAAELVGQHRTTIYRLVEKGTLTGYTDARGIACVDTQELLCVYAHAAADITAAVHELVAHGDAMRPTDNGDDKPQVDIDQVAQLVGSIRRLTQKVAELETTVGRLQGAHKPQKWWKRLLERLQITR
jgi:excisionase family DNA binding protein